MRGWVTCLLVACLLATAVSATQDYNGFLDDLCSNSAVVTSINGNMWVPWYSSSSSCTSSDLHQGSTCNSGEAIDATHNCMVSDEFSQVGILLAYGDNETRFLEFNNTLDDIRSTHGKIPAWRIYRSGNTIQACRSGINGNCDTASDATARIIIAELTAAQNPFFSHGTSYNATGMQLAADMAQYEVVHTCKPSSQGQQICAWLAAGYGAKSGGMASTDFGYTGYYPDAILAMLMACDASGDQTYCALAGNFTLNYLQAADFDGSTFSAPPGRSFQWTNLSGTPVASCTNTCAPVQWDYADAPRALGLCGVNNYAQAHGHTLPRLNAYCNAWNAKMTDPTHTPIQFYPSGANAASPQSGYYAQGLASLYYMGGDSALFRTALQSALSHYDVNDGTFDNEACFGVYTHAFALRADGANLSLAWSPVVNPDPVNDTPVVNDTPAVNNSNASNVTQNISVNVSQNITQNVSSNASNISNLSQVVYDDPPLFVISASNVSLYSTFLVNITVENATNVDTIRFDVVTGPELDLLNHSAGLFMLVGSNVTSNNPTSTTVFMNRTSGSGANGSGIVAFLFFNATSAGSTYVNITNVHIFDPSGIEIPNNVTNAVLIVYAPEETPEQPGNGHKYSPHYNKGDMKSIVVDGLGTAGSEVVSWLDLVILAMVVSGFIALAHKFK